MKKILRVPSSIYVLLEYEKGKNPIEQTKEMIRRIKNEGASKVDFYFKGYFGNGRILKYPYKLFIGKAGPLKYSYKNKDRKLTKEEYKIILILTKIE